MNLFHFRRFSMLVAALAVFGSVLFSRFTTPRVVLPPERTLDSEASSSVFPRSTGIAADVALPQAAEGESGGEQLSAPPVAASVKPNYPKPIQGTSRPPLTEAEVFRIQHPQYYLDYLKAIEDRMIADGFLPPGAYATFTAEAEVLGFWRDKGFGYFRAKGILSDADRAPFFSGLDEVRRLHAEEVRSLNDFYRGGAALDRRTELATVGVVPRWIQVFAAELANIFSPATARAQTCYQEGASTPGPGVNLAAPCCNCNVDGVPIGCLNLMCNGRAAIFDQTTFICGCA